MPTSASRASPGPLTTQPITATLIGSFTEASRLSISSAISMRGTSVRPHVGQLINVAPRCLSSSALRMANPARTSSTGSAVSETRIVSPIPSDKSVPIPTADRMTPSDIVPASVTPRCSGQSSASERIRYASIIRRGDDALAETTRSVKSSRSNSRTARTADAASASGVTPPYSSTSLLSSEPALTPTRMGTQALRASSTTFIKLSPSRILPGLILILLAPERMAEIAKR
jgi:hypothetical protein